MKETSYYIHEANKILSQTGKYTLWHEIIEQAQRDAYNEALMDAAMNVRLYKAANSGSWLDAAINTDSILKLKI